MKKSKMIALVLFALGLIFTGCNSKSGTKNLLKLDDYKPIVVVVSEPDFTPVQHYLDKGWTKKESLQGSVSEIIGPLSSIKEISFVDRTKSEQILKEHKFQISDWSDSNKTAEVGKALNANYILIPEIFDYSRDRIERCNINFLDINNMVKKTFNCRWGEFSTAVGPIKKLKSEVEKAVKNKEFSAMLLGAENPFEQPLLLKAKDIEKSSIAFKNKDLICPFSSSPNQFVSEREIKKLRTELNNVKSIEFNFVEATITTLDNQVKTYPFTFTPESNRLLVGHKDEFFTNGYIGELTLDGLEEDIPVYKNGKQFYLAISSTKAGGLGKIYYLPLK